MPKFLHSLNNNLWWETMVQLNRL